MNILSLNSDDDHLLQQAAQLLVVAFRQHWPDAWPTLEKGLEEVRERRHHPLLDPIREATGRA